MIYLYFTLVFLGSFLLTGIVRRYALEKNILDIPNERNSHSFPTPRGGGLAFVICVLTAMVIAEYPWINKPLISLELVIPAAFVAFLGFMDDRQGLSPKLRLFGHFAAAIVALYLFGGMPSIALFNWILPAGILLDILAVLYLVWLINLYNFMDGIDGLAAVEAICVCAGACLLYFLNGHYQLIFLPFSLLVAVSGFLIWNFPPARIFMGDAGSVFLGFILGLFSIQSAFFNPGFFYAWLILSGVFIVDATVTLIRRWITGRGLFKPHRSHAYQKASLLFNGHLPVTLGVLCINLLWLLPLALLTGSGLINPSLGILIAWLPLVILALSFGCGKEHDVFE